MPENHERSRGIDFSAAQREATSAQSAVRASTTIGLWAIVVVLTALLGAYRFTIAISTGIGIDLGFFLDAARHVHDHESAYDALYYVYSPLIAWILSPFASSGSVLIGWTVLSLAACVVTVIAVVWSQWRQLHSWQRPTLALVAVATLFADNALTVELNLGQTDTLVLASTALALLCFCLGRRGWAGGVLAIGAIVKSWPVFFALWLVRRGAQARVRAVISYAAVSVGFCLIVVVFTGPEELVRWVTRTLAMSDQKFAVWSAWGVGTEMLTETGHFIPIAEMPLVATIVDVTLGIYVVALLVFILIRPGTPSLSLWNIVMAVVLLLPVSHLQYQILFVPLVWTWLAWAMHTRWHHWALIGLIAASARWLSPLLLDPVPVDTRWKYLAIMVTSLVALGISVVLSPKIERGKQFEITEP